MNETQEHQEQQEQGSANEAEHGQIGFDLAAEVASIVGEPVSPDDSSDKAAEVKPDDKQAEQAAEEQAQEEPPQQREPKYRQLTEEEYEELVNFRANVQRKIDQAFGKLGSVDQALVELRSKAVTPSLQMSDEDFKELLEEFPELGEKTVAGLQRVFSRAASSAEGAKPAMTAKEVADEQAVRKLLSEQVGATEKRLISAMVHVVGDNTRAAEGLMALAKDNPEAAQLVVNEHLSALLGEDWSNLSDKRRAEIGDWAKTQPPEVQALAESDDIKDAAEFIRKFKARQGNAKKPQAPAPSQTPKQPNQAAAARASVVAAAVQPRGSAAVSASGSGVFDLGAEVSKYLQGTA